MFTENKFVEWTFLLRVSFEIVFTGNQTVRTMPDEELLSIVLDSDKNLATRVFPAQPPTEERHSNETQVASTETSGEQLMALKRGLSKARTFIESIPCGELRVGW